MPVNPDWKDWFLGLGYSWGGDCDWGNDSALLAPSTETLQLELYEKSLQKVHSKTQTFII